MENDWSFSRALLVFEYYINFPILKICSEHDIKFYFDQLPIVSKHREVPRKKCSVVKSTKYRLRKRLLRRMLTLQRKKSQKMVRKIYKFKKISHLRMLSRRQYSKKISMIDRPLRKLVPRNQLTLPYRRNSTIEDRLSLMVIRELSLRTSI